MSFDVTTLALAKSYTDQHGSGGGGASTADGVNYTNEHLTGTTNVKGALDELVTKSHSHDNKSILDKFAETDGKPTYNGEALGGGGEEEIFKIPVTVTELEEPADGEYFKVEHTVTLAELDAAVEEGKTPIVLADRGGVTYILSLLYYYSGTYLFCFIVDDVVASLVVGLSGDEGETPKEVWQYTEGNQTTRAENVYYLSSIDPSILSAKEALDKLLTDSHTHANKDALDKLSVSDGKLQYNGSDVGLKGDKGDTPVKGTDYWTAADKQEIIDDIHPVYYIDLTGTYPNYACPVAMDDITAAYNAGYNLVCRCQMGAYMAALPLFVPMPAVNTWIFSGSGALESMSFSAQSFTIAIINNRVMAQNEGLMPFPIPNKLIITAGNISYQYDGSRSVDFAVQPATQLITATGGGNITLADNTEYRLTDVTTLMINYLASNFECWMRLTFAESGDITVTLPADTKYIGTAPDFKNGETWVLRFKDRVLTAQKVGDGDKDADGITPTIGENGNWYIGSKDTGKPSRGLKGDKGDPGAPGKDGKTPVKGTDYWTAADKQEIVNDVIAVLPDGTEVSY